MRVFAKENTSPVASENGAPAPSEKSEGSGNWFRMHWRLISLFVIIAIAFVLRFAFAYGTSAGDDYALSGGSSASSHLRIITEILSGTYDPSEQMAVNYPYGDASVYGPLFDYFIAFFAWIVSLCGVSDVTAASGTLAWSAPIFGALTCIPVYLIGKKIFKGDKTIGLVSALFYAFFGLMIETTPFSNGTEYPFVCFLVAWLVYFVIKAFDAADKAGVTGIKSVVQDETVRMYALIAAVFMAFIVLSWNDFWVLTFVAAVMMFVALLFDRIGGKDFSATVGIVSIILLVSIVVGAIYYIPSGQWDTVFCGGCMVAVLTVVYSIIFLALVKKPWVVTVPLMVVIIIVVAAVFAVALPDLSDSMLHGSNIYEGSLMAALTEEFDRTSISEMASYYGWLTLWFPLVLGVWMAYKYRANAKSKVYTFTMLWMFAFFFIGWFNADYAVIAGSAFAVASAAVVVKVFRAVDLRSYFASLKTVRGSGFKGGLKKVVHFFPFITVIVAVFLVAVPTAVYAVDAATPTNDEHADYFGGLGYTINTSDSTLVSAAWDSYSSVGKDGALITWYGYSDTASSVGGFSSVTSTVGGGTSAMASTYLSDGSAGAIASMIIRLIEENPTDSKYTSTFAYYGLEDLPALLDSNKAMRNYIAANIDDFSAYNSDPASQSLKYIVGVHVLTETLSESKLSQLYNDIRILSANSINYVEVDSSMLPIYYGDGSYTSTIGYFGDYATDSTYGAPSKFYSVTSTTEMYYNYGYYDQLYYTYNDAMYETFLWNALIGVTPEQAGVSSTISLLSALASSDGTIKATPGAGLDHFNISYWHVMYRATENDDWKDMDAYEAIALQNANGGYINYLASVVILSYEESTFTTSGKVVDGNGDGLSGVKVAVFEKMTYDTSGNTSYVQRSTTFTDDSGAFTVSIPASDYLVRYYVGATGLWDGTIVGTEMNAVSGIELYRFDQDGVVVSSGNTAYAVPGTYVTFTDSKDKVVANIEVASDGSFTATDLVPDVYKVTVYDKTGTSLNSITVSLVEAISDFQVSASACSVTINLKDMYGNTLADSESAKVYLVDSNGNTFEFDNVKSGDTVSVAKGSYTVYASGSSYVSVESKTVTASTSSTASAELTVYAAGTVSATEGYTYMSLGYSATATSSSLYVPAALVDSLTEYNANDTTNVVKVSIALKDASGNDASGTVAFVNGDDVYVFSVTDGAATVTIPKNTYSVYATDNSGLAVFKPSQSLTVDECNLSLEMATAYKATATVNYHSLMPSSSSTTGILYVPLTFNVKIGDDSYTIPMVTGSSGLASIYVPSESVVSYTVKNTYFNDGVYDAFALTGDFTSDESTVTASTTLTALSFAIAKDDSTTPQDPDYYVKSLDYGTISISDEDGAAFSGYLKLANNSSSYTRYVKVEAGYITEIYKNYNDETKEYSETSGVLYSGRYTVTYNGDDGAYYIDSQYVYFYPNTESVTLEVMNSWMATVTYNSTDTLAVVAVDDGDYEAGTSSTESGVTTAVYYLEQGKDFYFTATNTDKIVYSKAYNHSSALSETADLTTLSDVVTLSGYVGANVDGNIVAYFNSSYEALVTVTDGEYSVDLPKDAVISSMLLTASAENDDYTYSVTDFEILDEDVTMSEDATRNFAVSYGRALTDDTVTIDADNSNMDIDGTGVLAVAIKNTNDYDCTYFVQGSDVFVLDKVYALTVAAGSSDTVYVGGFYNEKTVGAGSESATITVTTIDGTEVQTVVIPATIYEYSNGDFDSFVYPSDDDSGVYDAVDGYSYKYAVMVDNKNTMADKVTVTLKSTLPAGWVAKVSDESGYYITDSGSEYVVNGLAKTTLYVVLTDVNGNGGDIPEVEIEIANETSSRSHECSAGTAAMSESDGSASGDDVDEDKADIPALFWVLVVLTILALLLLVWSGMKRGVFARRN